MIHLGDITKISGYDAPIVDVITGGSPCQDLSVAGKRAGLEGERSGLFMEQIRIVKEMREHDRNSGRAGMYVRPRYCVWENVPGAFSSNGGKDFQAVLSEFVRVADPEAPDVPMPEKGKWSKSGCLYDELGRWSIAWRVHDAQFWGVPQRRKRIALVADFGGLSAPEILFERKGLSGDFEPGGEKREGSAVRTEDSTGGAICYGISSYDSNAMKSPNPHSGIYEADTSRTLDLNGGNPACNQGGMAIVEPIPINTMLATRDKALGRGTGLGIGKAGDAQFTISAAHEHAVLCLNDQGGAMMNVSEDVTGALRAQEHGHQPIVAGFKAGQSMAGGIGYQEEVAATLSSQMSGTEPTVYVARGNGNGSTVPTVVGTYAWCRSDRLVASDVGCCQNARQHKSATDLVVCAVDSNKNGFVEMAGTLQAGEKSGGFQDCVSIGQSIVRRLTPLECERLQGFPDNWTDIGDWTDSKGKLHKAADSPRYKALGNSIALPFWQYLARRICAQYERPITMASLFDGIGGFPLVFERCGAKAVWASEIEEFPMAVTRERFKEERNERTFN